ncbi:helix-turn-helix transcriptional regulator [Phenylobacterium montanum]|uniref:YafY family transcriptional regulator n=1 Tax=Phenylobacterium montanum TaxID=2823693 RepID=A0A975IT80_9CAUL|nr:YafY family protein [Caulobacter sp. S6]QUD86204.1 YafY family transcriptional regulator [Caulobacter sp. S6]
MRRAERLFQIIQILRRAHAPVTAQAIAEELETSVRTIYRDIAELLAQRVPVRGEAGIGYLMDKGFDLPPLMLTPDEIEAAVLGAQWVAGRADPELARAARDLVAKIGAVIPGHLRPFLLEATGTAAGRPRLVADALDLSRLRAWIRAQKKLTLTYRDEGGATSERTVWPIAIGYYETSRVIAAWCELRQDFRHFRTDRVVAADFVDERYPARREALRAAWRKSQMEAPRWSGAQSG